MKIKYIFTSFYLGILFVQGISAQIGIQTEFPKALFHIDGARDNPQDQVTPLTDAQAYNDMVITTAGNIGIGTVNPTTKLHIKNNVAGVSDAYGLRMTPGIGAASILHLENDAQTVSWVPNPSLGIVRTYKALAQTYLHYKAGYPMLTDMNGGSMGLLNGYKIVIPSYGRYLVTVSIDGVNSSGGATSFESIAVFLAINDTEIQDAQYPAYAFNLRASNQMLDDIEFYEATNDWTAVASRPQSFSTALFAGICNQDDYLVVRLVTAVSYMSPFTTNTGDIIITLINI